jgi:hypothetical protein
VCVPDVIGVLTVWIQNQKKKKRNGTPTHTVTEIRGHCSEGGKGWGLSSSIFPFKNTLILETLAHLKQS